VFRVKSFDLRRWFATPDAAATARPLALVTLALLPLRLWARAAIGYGDSEALYATWGAHPQLFYRDHPGLLGIFARGLAEGAGGIPTPTAIHGFSLAVLCGFPFLFFAVCRLFQRDEPYGQRRALVAAVAVAVTPELAIGLFGFTPDLVLAPLWLAALGAAGFALQRNPGETRADGAAAMALACAVIATAAKATGGLLVLALLSGFVASPRWRRSPWPWLGLATVGTPLLLVASGARDEFRAMLEHRFITTQASAGFSLRNAGAVVGGQLAYLTPGPLALVLLAATRLLKLRRSENADEPTRDQQRLLRLAMLVPLAGLLPFSLWSRVAEPHWLAPALLAPAIFAGTEAGSKALVRPSRVLAALMSAGALTVVVHLWVLVPAAAKLRPDTAEARLDIANELYGWDKAVADVPVVENAAYVGPHWTVCAQLAARLGGNNVGCLGPTADDFDRWNPKESWTKKPIVVFVTDDRFPVDLSRKFPQRNIRESHRVNVFRGGRLIRTFTITTLERSAQQG
jgi:hypothetical protein